MASIEKLWYRTEKLTWLHKLLIPFSTLYQALMCGRRFLYRYQIKKTTYFPVPVIVVGNLTVGGTGKTPVVIALCDWLQQQGYKPGIVSRGYGGGATSWPQVVTERSSAAMVGDEPLMLHKKAKVPVVVDPKRVRAVETLLQQFDCDVVLSDDGLQHLSLGREIEVVVVDADRQFGNGYCLPLGPLREGVSRLDTVDFVLYRGQARSDQYQVNICVDKVRPVVGAQGCKQLSEFSENRVHALAAIGNPQRFFQLLQANGLQVKTHVFRDHYSLSAADFSFLGENESVIMTEKDAIKCVDFADHRYFYLSIYAELPSAFLNKLSKLLSSYSKVMLPN